MSDSNKQWQIVIRRKAKRTLQRVPVNLKKRLSAAIDQLAHTPYPMGYRKIVGMENLYRIRVGDWRILYLIENDELVIIVIDIAPRGQIYRNL